MRLFERISGSKVVVTSAVLALLVALPSVGMGYFLDDLLHLAVLEGMKAPATPGDLFVFASGDAKQMAPFIERGPYPWWTHPEVKLAFFRPLSSALHRVDHALFGRAALAAHLHSVLWYVGLVALAAALFRRTLPAFAAALAGVLFAIDDAHWMPAAWIANRNALVAAVPALWGVWAHLRWREEGWSVGRLGSVLGLVVGLCGGETALGAFGYLFAYELTVAPGTRKQRALALLPALTVGLGYLAVYKVLGYGARDSAIYLDPASTPLRFLAAALPRALALFGSVVLSSPVDLWMFAERSKPWLVAVGAGAMLLSVWVLRHLWAGLEEPSRRWARFWAFGCILSLGPGLATFPANRLLLFPSLGGLALIALAIQQLRADLSRGWRGGAWALFVLHAVLPWPTWLVMPRLFQDMGRRTAHAAATMEVDDAKLPTQRLVVLAAPDAAIALYAPVVHVQGGGSAPYAWWTLAMDPFGHRVTRTGPRELELEVLGGHMLDTVFEQLVRAEDRPVSVGDVVRLDGAQVRVLAADGPYPTRISVRFEKPLEDSGYVLLRWDGQTLRQVPPPALGQQVDLPHFKGPMEPQGAPFD